MFYERGKILNTSVGAQGCTQCVLERSTESKHTCKLKAALIPQEEYSTTYFTQPRSVYKPFITFTTADVFYCSERTLLENDLVTLQSSYYVVK